MFAYFDETGTSGGAERLTAVAGYLFDSAGIERFTSLYREQVEPLLPVDKRGRKVFHTTKIAGGYGQFFGMPAEQREDIFRAMVAILSQSVTLGSVIAIEPDEYTAGLRGRYMRLRTSDPRDSFEQRVGSKYSLCLLRCMQSICQWLDTEGIPGRVQFTCEAGGAGEVEGEVMLSRISANLDLRRRFRWGGHVFARKSSAEPGLFAADYLAWEWQRMDHNSERPERGEWRTTIGPLIEARPHVAAYMTEKSVGSQALMNTHYALRGPDDAFWRD